MLQRLVLAALVASFGLASSAPASPLQGLKPGSKAPALSIEEWIQGKEIKQFAPGRIYVVEFWATWCPPCIKGIPHLNELSKKYASNVTVVGVAGSERGFDQDPKGVRERLKRFVSERAATMTYTVAFDSDSTMARDWLYAAGAGTIPTAFLVDGVGKIAWIGHPSQLDAQLAKLAESTPPPKEPAGAVTPETDARAQAQQFAKTLAELEASGDWAAVLRECERAFQATPALEAEFGRTRFQALLTTGDYAGASTYGQRLVEGLAKDDAQFLNEIAWLIVDPENTRLAKRDSKLALAAASRASELTKHSRPEVLDTLACAHFHAGDTARALEVQKRAVELAKGSPFETKLAKRLEQFQKVSKDFELVELI